MKNSITNAIKKSLNRYNKVPTMMLFNQTRYGIKVHQLVEDLLKENIIHVPCVSFVRLAVESASKFIDRYNIQPEEIEEPVIWVPNTGELWTTRSDFIGYIKNEKAIMDIKTTKNIDLEACRCQLSAYAWALCKREGYLIKNLWIMWLPKDSAAKMIKIDLMPRDEVLQILRSGKTDFECWEASNYRYSSGHKIW